MEQYCRERVTKVEGRNEFQSRSYTAVCGRDVEDGHQFCHMHEKVHARQLARAQFKHAQRAARRARAAR